MNKKTHKKFLD